MRRGCRGWQACLARHAGIFLHAQPMHRLQTLQASGHGSGSVAAAAFDTNVNPLPRAAEAGCVLCAST